MDGSGVVLVSSGVEPAVGDTGSDSDSVTEGDGLGSTEGDGVGDDVSNAVGVGDGLSLSISLTVGVGIGVGVAVTVGVMMGGGITTQSSTDAPDNVVSAGAAIDTTAPVISAARTELTTGATALCTTTRRSRRMYL